MIKLYQKIYRVKSEFIQETAKYVIKRTSKKKQDIPIIYLSLKDKETPVIAKLFASVTVVYALSPIDLIPDFIPILGYLDDIIILPALIVLTIKLILKKILEKNRVEAQELWKDGKPKKWYFALPIILLWILFAFLIIKAFFN